MIITCPRCNARYLFNKEVEPTKKIRVTCKKCLYSFTFEASHSKEHPNKTILIAHDDFRVINVIKKILERSNFNIECAYDGNTALSMIKKNKPRAAIIDVALPGVFGFELCEKIKNDPNLKDIVVILVASIYDRTRYKRKPQNLYGADDYIEKHHIPDDLLPKLLRHINGEKKALQKEEFIQKEVAKKDILKDNRDLLLAEQKLDLERDIIKQHENDYITSIPQIPERAKKLARLIVSDIALYNQDTINLVTPDNYYEKLKMDIDDGIKYLSQKIPELAKDAKSVIDQAIKELIMQKERKQNDRD